MSINLQGFKVAILVADGFEQSEMSWPKKALDEIGATTHLISPNNEQVIGWKGKDWGDQFAVDVALNSADAKDYDALVLPGGVINPDKLRILGPAISFIQEFVRANKPIAAICHGPWTLINAGGVAGKTMTSWSSLELDLKNAGAHWVDRDVVRDGKLVTSRKPDDLPAFTREMIQLFHDCMNNK